jgi:pyruvate/2-oxoglutarate dehydrogenase complex dihydrolipoamide acyltransferase (E2) component
MAVGTGKKVFVANGGPDDLATETQMVVSLSCDRRVVDEEVAAVYLKTFQTYVNNPEMLMA